MRGSRAAGEPGDREVGGAPEQMHRAALTDEAGAELLEHPVGLDEDLPEPVGVLAVVGPVRFVLLEGDGILDLVGLRVDLDRQAERRELRHQPAVERRHRLRLERERRGAAAARLHHQAVVDEVEIDLKALGAVRDRRGGQPAGGDVVRGMPGVVDPGAPGQPDLAGDLQPQMQGREGLTPGFQGQARPAVVRACRVRWGHHARHLLVGHSTPDAPGLAGGGRSYRDLQHRRRRCGTAHLIKTLRCPTTNVEREINFCRTTRGVIPPTMEGPYNS
jgi:hypothetical protein